MQAALSPALETALDYYLRVLAIAITYAGPVLLQYKEELNHIITSAFQAPSWKVILFFYLLIHLDRQYPQPPVIFYTVFR
jgi:proteasome activator subunit 4